MLLNGVIESRRHVETTSTKDIRSRPPLAITNDFQIFRKLQVFFGLNVSFCHQKQESLPLIGQNSIKTLENNFKVGILRKKFCHFFILQISLFFQ